MVANSEQFEKILAAALKLSTVDKLRLIARVADSLADDLEKAEQGKLNRSIEWSGTITSDQRLVVQVPEGFPPSDVKVLLEWPDGIELNDTTIDQLKITIQLPNTEAIRLWFTEYLRKQGTSR